MRSNRPTIASNIDLSNQWDYRKNEADPEVLTQGSSKKAWWTCDEGHSYEMSIYQKCIRGNGCPICSGHRTVPGVNDFATIYPELAKEWHPTKNGNKSPSNYSKKNGGRFWWLCKNGHEWEASIKDRANGRGCPFCNSRRTTSFPEQAIYFYIKKLYPETMNRYRDIFDNGMELDIFVPSIRFAVEFDGANWHNDEEAHKKEKKKYDICKSNNITLFRVKEHTGEQWDDVADAVYIIHRKSYEKDLPKVIRAILDSIDPKTNLLTRKIPNAFHSLVDVNIERDRNAIMEYLSEIPNSLVEIRPDLIQDWNYKRNGNITPDMFGINSNDKVWWKCHACGHEWQTSIIHRAGKRNSGCPICSRETQGRTFTKLRVAERGSLSDNNPILAKDWHPTRNGDLKPTDITVNSPRKVWWLCNECGYEWETSPNNRNGKGVGCPCCSGRVPKIGVNDFKTLFPELAKEWNYEKNVDLRPDNYLPKSNKKVWWTCCKCGHTWQATINNRTSGHGCPKYRNHKKHDNC